MSTILPASDHPFASFLSIFSDLEDPRRDHVKVHPLPDVLVLVLLVATRGDVGGV